MRVRRIRHFHHFDAAHVSCDRTRTALVPYEIRAAPVYRFGGFAILDVLVAVVDQRSGAGTRPRELGGRVETCRRDESAKAMRLN